MCLFFIVVALMLPVERSAAFPGEGMEALRARNLEVRPRGTGGQGGDSLNAGETENCLPDVKLSGNKPRPFLSNERSAGVGWRTARGTRLHRNPKKNKGGFIIYDS